MDTTWQERRRDANWVLITRTVVIYVIGHDYYDVEYYKMLTGTCVKLGYDTIRDT